MNRPLWALQKAALVGRLAIFDALRIGKRRGFVSIGAGTVFAPAMELVLGSRVYLAGGDVFQGEGRVEIGERTYVGYKCVFNSVESIRIGKNCMLANFVSIVDNNHGMDRDRPMIEQPRTGRAITIGDNCWLGERVTILAGVRIGDGAVIAAGSIVTRDVEVNTLALGAPARALRVLT